MYIGFNLCLDERAIIFGGLNNYKMLQKLGKNHLNEQKAKYEKNLKLCEEKRN